MAERTIHPLRPHKQQPPQPFAVEVAGLREEVKEVNESLAGLNERIDSTNEHLADIAINVKSPPAPLVGAKGDDVTDDTAALQAIINYAATRGKKIFIPYGTYLISSPLVLPSGSLEWGIEISGAKSETKYQYLPGSKSTVIKANAVMASMITNRGANPAVNVAYYNVVKNLVLDGNNLAVKGYINGWQDKFLDSSVIQCTGVGVSFGDLTNLTIVREVTMALNAKGFESIDSDSTIWYLNKCTIRENTSDGATISAAVGAVISSCVFEANAGKALVIKGTTDPLKRVTGLKLADTCYFEGNTGYAIEIDSTGSTVPIDIEFDKPWINAADKAINIIKGDNINFKNPNLVGTPTSPNYFINAGGDNVTISGNETALSSANLNITGAKASSVIKTMVKTIGASKGQVFNNVTKAAVLQPNPIVCTNNKNLLPEELAGTILNNDGQSGVNIGINLPVPTENYRFRFVCSVSQPANNFRFNTDGQATIFLDGVVSPKAWIEIVNPKIGDCIEFMAFAADNYYWIAKPIRGTWTTY